MDLQLTGWARGYQLLTVKTSAYYGMLHRFLELWDLVNTVTKLRVPLKAGIFLTS
jgi:hypothetical protein